MFSGERARLEFFSISARPRQAVNSRSCMISMRVSPCDILALQLLRFDGVE